MRDAVAKHPAEEVDPNQQPGQSTDEVPRRVPEGRFTNRARDTHTAVQAELAHGYSLREIARRLRMTRKTVTKYARAATPESLFRDQWQNRATILDPFKPYLCQRWSDGCTKANRLYDEIKELGFKGSYSTVCHFLLPLREGRPPSPLPPSPRTATRWIMSHPDHLHEDNHQYLKRLLELSPELASATAHVRAFATLMDQRDGARLPDWIAAVRADPACGLSSFATGLETDQDAVVYGLSTKWSSGPVEGRVNDLKALKRAMFGRAGLPLLRKRLLLIASSRRPLTVTGATTS
ncbi:transposase [Streptomyces sp. NPDC059037]|uniref:transposase n=1 Tax=Streptomyces sp. NPDC059037 TaxID=3346710 RepID=UPI0036C376A7